jgi:hypothetical protein
LTGPILSSPSKWLAHTQQWIEHFTSEGYDPQPLAAGVDGAIYDLGNDLVAKVWRDRRPAQGPGKVVN